ncbi:transposase domain-containing protein, partial [Pseudomonas yamanorum]|uniref:transposase domain-containing protein n=1 Tax=Pseudomonas yamanorum TaxID=515393 RepID=UPI0021121EBF
MDMRAGKRIGEDVSEKLDYTPGVFTVECHGRSNWLFAGSLRSGKRAAAIMSLIQTARLNGHDPYAYLKDVLTRLPTQRASEITELLPHKWGHI